MTEKYGSNFGCPDMKSRDGSLVKKSKPSSSSDANKVVIYVSWH